MSSDVTGAGAGVIEVFQQNGGLFVRVPWERAEHFQDVLKAAGVGSTLHLDAENKEARLELWESLPPEQILALLGEHSPPAEPQATVAVQ